jgi:hypothetical protein
MCPISRSRGSSAVKASVTNAPLRNTVMRSLMRYTWSMKCVTNSTAIPSARSRSRMSNRSSTSDSSRLEVGSSRMSTFASASSARAIATSCCTAIGCSSSRRAGCRSRPIRSSAARAFAWLARQLISPARFGNRPAHRFSATDSVGTRFTSWYTVLIPSRSASRGELGRIAAPSSVIVPASGACTPVSTLMSVLFPAPFSPMSACTSPRRSVSRASSRARTPGKVFTTPSACSTGASPPRSVGTDGLVTGGSLSTDATRAVPRLPA